MYTEIGRDTTWQTQGLQPPPLQSLSLETPPSGSDSSKPSTITTLQQVGY